MTDELQAAADAVNAATNREYRVLLYVECYAEITVLAADEDEARDAAREAVDRDDLNIDTVDVQEVTEVVAA